MSALRSADYRGKVKDTANGAAEFLILLRMMMKQVNRAAGKKTWEDISMDDGDHMDVAMINALIHSLFTIFATMVKLKIQPGTPVTKQGNVSKGVVSGLIGMKAEGASGSVALSLTLPAIREISRNLLGYEITSANKEAEDLVGELTNMLAGGAKRIMSERGHDFDMQIPQLLSGDEHIIVHLYHGQTVLLPFNINQDEFYIELNFV
jgi:chemotaxis protein CheX